MIVISNLQSLSPATTGNGRQGQAATGNNEQPPPRTGKNEQEPTRMGVAQIGVILWPWRDGGVFRKKRTSNARPRTLRKTASRGGGPQENILTGQKDGLEILTCCLTVTYILRNRKKAAVRHPKRTRFLPKRFPIVPSRVQIIPRRVRIGPRSQVGADVPFMFLKGPNGTMIRYQPGGSRAIASKFLMT